MEEEYVVPFLEPATELNAQYLFQNCIDFPSHVYMGDITPRVPLESVLIEFQYMCYFVTDLEDNFKINRVIYEVLMSYFGNELEDALSTIETELIINLHIDPKPILESISVDVMQMYIAEILSKDADNKIVCKWLTGLKCFILLDLKDLVGQYEFSF